MTILNTIELMKVSPACKGICCGCFISLVLFIVASICQAGRDGFEKYVIWYVLGIIVSFVGAIVCVYISDNFTVPTGEYQYEILIDDTVSFTDVTEKYNIIEQRGEIFVVEEKTNDENPS